MKKLLSLLALSLVACVYAQQKVATTFDAASCFAVEGISKLEVVRRPVSDALWLNTSVTVSNFTEKVLGADKKQPIKLKAMKVKVDLIRDITQPPVTIVGEDANGNPVTRTEQPTVPIGTFAWDTDFEIPINGLQTIIPIGLGKITTDPDKKVLDNGTFDRLVEFFNYMNGSAEQRKNLRVVMSGIAIVAVRGENNMWMWGNQPVNFSWRLKPDNTNKYILSVDR